jgi:FKBP-type peptidyl-prolyl cis-trans isomerase
VRVVTSPDYKTSSSGLLFKDYDEGMGPQPEEGQQVSF